jgi:hypothetical protein
MGHRCGYVGIPKDHPLHGLSYHSKSKVLRSSDIQDMPMNTVGLGQMLNGMMGKYDEEVITPEMYFSVHGGITYSGGNDYPVKSDGLWWFGYDCAHYGDGVDLSAIENETAKEIEMSYPSYGIVRTKEYCEEECKKLAEQLKKVAK